MERLSTYLRQAMGEVCADPGKGRLRGVGLRFLGSAAHHVAVRNAQTLEALRGGDIIIVAGTSSDEGKRPWVRLVEFIAEVSRAFEACAPDEVGAGVARSLSGGCLR